MYKLIRRISSSFFPRPDRPWNDDATSNAPRIGQKRRMSSPDVDDAPNTLTSAKKLRREDTELVIDSPDASPAATSASQQDVEGVKEVTKGVRDVELDDINGHNADEAVGAAAVPLPDSPVLEAQVQGLETPDTKHNAEELSDVDAAGPTEPIESAEKSETAEASTVAAEVTAEGAVVKENEIAPVGSSTDAVQPTVEQVTKASGDCDAPDPEGAKEGEKDSAPQAAEAVESSINT